MSQLYGTELRTAVKTAAVAAWGVSKVHYGNPMLPQATVPYAVIRLDSVPMEWLTVKDVEQRYRFEVYYVAKWAADQVVEDLKVTKANALIAELMDSVYFATKGMLPLVSQVSFEESDDPNEPTYMVQVDFEVVVHSTGIVSGDAQIE